MLLLHGFPEFWWTWRHQLTALPEAGFRAVAVDLRGYGGSDKPPRGYDLVTAAADAAGLVRALGEANAIVVGHGLGGLIAWTVAAYHAKVIRRQAAREEAVEDLVKRCNRAIAKLEAAARLSHRPSSGRPPSAAPSAAMPGATGTDADIEVLVCQGCNGRFERPRVRGRKPMFCPACRTATQA